MQEIKFRGVSKTTGLFLYGDLLHLNGQVVIIPFDSIENIDVGNLLVYPDTVSEYTGQKDSAKWADLTAGEQQKWCLSKYMDEDGTICFNTPKNWVGRDIYGGDSLLCSMHKSQANYNVSWNSNCSMFELVEQGINREDECEINYYSKENMKYAQCQVVSNIYGIEETAC